MNVLPYPAPTKGYGFAPDLSKENPGSLYHLIYAMAQETEQSAYLLVQFFDIDLALRMRKARNLIVQVAGVRYHPSGVQHMKGGKRALVDGEHLIPLDSSFEFIYAYELRQPDRFMFAAYHKLKRAGTYKECLGGGWSSTIPLTEYNGHYYAVDLEMSSGVDYTVRADLGLRREDATL